MNNYSPNFERLNLSKTDSRLISPFFSNLNKPVFAVQMLPPELIGALCSRTSRARDDLRVILLKEFIKPFIQEKSAYGQGLKRFISFLHRYPADVVFANPKSREFYIKWLAQYGDDSIAQMAGTHLVYSALSQVAIKHIEDMRVGIAPIEKSTRYVDYSTKINGKYRYYTDPTLKKMGLHKEYTQAMDGLFDTYTSLLHSYLDILKKRYPDERESLLKTKVFDTIRGILPFSTLSQVAFFANGQAFEYMLARSLNHSLGEVRWAASQAYEELSKMIPAFLRRTEGETAGEYREYLSGRREKIEKTLKSIQWSKEKEKNPPAGAESDSAGGYVKLLEHEKDGEEKVIAGLIYPHLHESYETILQKVKKMNQKEKEHVLEAILKDRKARWYKTPRAFEMANVTFEITVNIGAWKDLHRHRMLTQMRELFHIHHGYDLPAELIEVKLDMQFRQAIENTEKVFMKIEKKDPELAQYAVTQAHRVRFLQKQNLRSFFWETELRSISQGHPDYRHVAQEKGRQLKKVYPLLGKYLMIDMNEYDFARRGTTKKIEEKEAKLRTQLK